MKLCRTALITLLAIGLAGAVSCGVGKCEPPPFTALPSLETYSDSLVSIMYPADWEEDPEFSGYAGYGVTMGFMVSDPTGTTSCNMVIEDLPKPMSAAEYSRAGEIYLKSLDSYNKICEETIYVDGVEAVKTVYQFRILGMSTKQMQVALVDGMEGWAFTFSTTPGQWDQWAYTFDFMANSIQIH